MAPHPGLPCPPHSNREAVSRTTLGVLAAHLHNEGPVLRAHFTVQVLLPVVGITDEDLGVQHGGVTELGPMPAAQQPPGQLALVHHGGHHMAGPSQGAAPELKTLQLRHLRCRGEKSRAQPWNRRADVGGGPNSGHVTRPQGCSSAAPQSQVWTPSRPRTETVPCPPSRDRR